MAFRETPEMVGFASRVIKSIGRRVGEEDPSSLVALVSIEQALDNAYRNAVDGLRAHGFSDRMIGEELGVTQQAVNKRWPQRVTE